jgi:hypothetical protein
MECYDPCSLRFKLKIGCVVKLFVVKYLHLASKWKVLFI